MRSRAVRRDLACWLSIAFGPPPSRIFSSSLRTWATSSATARMLDSKRRELASTLVARTLLMESAVESVRSLIREKFQSTYYTSGTGAPCCSAWIVWRGHRCPRRPTQFTLRVGKGGHASHKSTRRLQLTQRLGNGIVGDCVHQSNFERARGGNFFRGDEKLQRSAFPDQARQTLRASPPGHEAESGAAMSEDGVGRGDPAVTGEREIKTSAHAVAFDRGNDGGGITGDCVHEGLSHGGELASCGAGQHGVFF